MTGRAADRFTVWQQDTSMIDPTHSDWTDLLTTLDLRGPVTEASLREAYRRKALHAHPDQSASRDGIVEFQRIQRAYDDLRVILRNDRSGATIGRCARCAAVAPLSADTAGRACCAACRLKARSRLLPLPVLSRVYGFGVVAVQALSVLFTGVAAWSGRSSWAWVGLFCAAASFAALVWTLARVDRIERRRRASGSGAFPNF
jgi:hypothetical protein